MAQWTNTGVTMPQALSGFASARCGGKLYILGGLVGGAQLSNAIHILDLNRGTWSAGRSMPLYLQSAKAVASGGCIYLVGGMGGSTSTASNPSYRVLQYDIAGNQWTQTAINSPVCQYMGLAACGEYIYVLGGLSGLTEAYAKHEIYYFSISDPIQRFQLSATLPNSSGRVTSQTIGSKIYSVSGSEMYVLDLETLQVTTATGPPMVKELPLSTCYCDELWAARSGSLELEVYSVGSGVWRTETAAPAEASAAGGVEQWEGALYWLPNTYGSTRLAIYTRDMRRVAVYSPSPSSGFVNEREAGTFTWALASTPPTRQQSADFQWRVNEAGPVNTVSVTGETTAITLPPDTFPDGSFQWRVMATGENGVASDYTQWMTLTTVDERPNKPTNLYPNSGTRDGTGELELSWLHNAPLSTPQSAFEIQVSYDNGSSYMDFSGKVTSSVVKYTAPANSFAPAPAGVVGWRVRTYNSDDVPGEWSDAVFFAVLPAPEAPAWRGVEQGRSRPAAQWISTGQQAYRLQVLHGDNLVYDTGQRYGTATTHKVCNYLANGQYAFRVRIQNLFGLWSDWAEYVAIVAAKQTMGITLTGEAVENGARLKFIAEEVSQ